MEMLASHIDGIKIIKPTFKSNEFGDFADVYSESIFLQELEIEDKFIIDHHITSKRGVIYGLYYQISSYVQSYLIRCVKGIVFCVFVDLRIDSESYGEYFSMRISDADQLQIYACEGFAMGFVSITDAATVLIKTNKEWDNDNCRYIKYDDDELDIEWLVDKEDIKYNVDLANSFDEVEKF